jgi:hypothetical protein
MRCMPSPAEIAARRGLLERVRQYALYNALGCLHPVPRAVAAGTERRSGAPAPALAPALAASAPMPDVYPSQRNTWIGLFPFVVLHYLLRGEQQLQGVALARLQQRPHQGALYYENRRFYRWEQLQQDLAQWRASR